MAEDKIQGFRINRNGYGTIPKSVMQDQDLSIAAKAVYSYFCSFTGSGDVCFPSRKKICYDLGIANNSLSKYINELRRNGYLDVEQVKENGRFSHNIYTLPDVKLPCTKNCDTENLGDGNLHTNNNSSKTNIPSKKNKEEKDAEEQLLMVCSLLGKYGYSLFQPKVSELQTALISFVEFRKGIKKPMTSLAVDLLIKKLQDMTPDVEEQIEIINQSILNGWQGIFPLKNKQPARSNMQQSRKNTNVFLDMLDDEL